MRTCGCGAVVARRFVRGHNQRGKPRPMLGRKVSMETRRRISEAQRGRVFSAEHRRRISEAKTGRKRTLSPEHCRAISEGRTGITVGPLTPAHRAAISKAMTGRELTPEHRAAISRGMRKGGTPSRGG